MKNQILLNIFGYQADFIAYNAILKLLSGALRTMGTDQYLYCDLTHLMWAGSPNEDMTSLIRNGQRR